MVSSDPLAGSDPFADPGLSPFADSDLPVSGGAGAGPVSMPVDTAAPTPPAAEDLAPDTATAPSAASEPSGSTGTRDVGMMSGMIFIGRFSENNNSSRRLAGRS